MDEQWKQWILFLERPAFGVENGRIAACNDGAEAFDIHAGQPVAPLLQSGREEYEQFTDGCLYLPLELGGVPVWASVQQVANGQLFILERTGEERELRALALAAQNLRVPLSNIMIIADRLFPRLNQLGDERTAAQMAEINRGLFQLLRTVGNMSDAGQLTNAHQENTELGSFLGELYERGRELLQTAGVELTYECPRQDVNAAVDRQLLERAVYNLLSNSVKFTGPGGKVLLRLESSGDLVRIVVRDNGDGVDDGVRGSVFARYRRDPGLGDSRWGIGLGLQLVQQAARFHGGAVLLRRLPEGGTEMVLSIRSKAVRRQDFRSPIMQLDYAGERDHALIELADVLPAKVFQVENVN